MNPWKAPKNAQQARGLGLPGWKAPNNAKQARRLALPPFKTPQTQRQARNLQPTGPRTPAEVQKLRDFLIHHGYNLDPHGSAMGSLLVSALKNWSSGVHNRSPDAWNRNHPLQQIAHDQSVISAHNEASQQQVAQDKRGGAKNLPKHNVPANSPIGHFHGGNGGGGGGFPGADALGMLGNLLGQSNTEKMIPLDLADQAASPYTAQAATFADQINRLPAAKKKALQNISDWFGQVQKAEQHGAQQDQKLANAGSSAMQDATKGIMASLGGSAMAGSGEVGAMGANDANTLTAMGANDAALANELAPIFKASEAQAKNSRSTQYDNQLSDLQDQKGQATGQADAARAAAVQAILGANNSARQTNFGNATGLLNTMAGLEISGANAVSQSQERSIMNALHMSEIQRNAQKSVGGLDALTPSQRTGLANALNAMLMDPNTNQLKSGLSWPNALQDVRNYIRTQGLNPLNKQVINQFIAPTLANAGIKFQNPNALYRP